ncbi:phospholipase [Hyphomicrobium nitrativorans NL23]|uniref:Phospholipase n=1 Tax=Hyphomicrobium nitrativorans NL23 TaxID=1029756 RepID=V5SFM6_9HYPH|nr:alpha/beta fold hydrolase [Hyphomicrobium nitrativorans]AHB49323.1 phospholipase [Hyphomicrobium nitrativorans NL23]
MTAQTFDVVRAGVPLEAARAAAVLIHGRGATAEGMLALGGALGAKDVALIAPQAPAGSWYSHSFLAPLEENEPHLSQALGIVGETVDALAGEGLGPERIVLIGFSQGACLALEYAARTARRYGGVAGLSGGLIGPPGTPRDYAGSLAATPVFLGCSDVDAHIPEARVHESADVLTALGGNVTTRIYPGMAHTIVDDEIRHVQRILADIPPRR